MTGSRTAGRSDAIDAGSLAIGVTDREVGREWGEAIRGGVGIVHECNPVHEVEGVGPRVLCAVYVRELRCMVLFIPQILLALPSCLGQLFRWSWRG